ncbi:MAG: polyprenyl synthetase family protein [Acidobacteria bacterium]|nr:polyprenyl synthetase family protein [Acidobacteriota bacterium]
MRENVTSFQQAHQIREVFGSVAPRLGEVQQFLDRELDQALPPVREIAGYVLGSGGKRVRPALVLLISRMLGYSGERDIRYAAVIEMIHTATLIHDDIIDESDLRRGKPTANRKWGNQGTVLVGDWLYTRTMDLSLELGDVEVMRLLTSATLQMIEGEILADHVRGVLELDEDTYMDITRRKTAELFSAACALPALFQVSTLHLTETLAEFGRSLGMCFQLVDDALDFTSSRSELGKPVMADLREGRMTLPMILLLPRLSRNQRKQIADVLTSGEFGGMGQNQVLEMIKTSGVLDEVHRRASAFADRAVQLIEKLPSTPERATLAAAVTLLLDRRS